MKDEEKGKRGRIMKLLTYIYHGREDFGVLCKNGEFLCSAGAVCQGSYRSLAELIAALSTEDRQRLEAAAAADPPSLGLPAVPFAEAVLCAPIPEPAQDVICLGLNYAGHARESARFKKGSFEAGEQAVYFAKRVDRAVGCGGFIDSHPGVVDSLDYEVELAAVIGREARKVSPEKAWDHVFGYTIINDVSARNVQTRHKQWFFGKSLDTFCPMGPWIVTADEFRRPPLLKITSRVNGETRQESDTGMMIFGVDHVISELSQAMTLKSGTVIAMGTPAGVGMGFVPPRFLKPGDVVECEIEGIGCLTNTVK